MERLRRDFDQMFNNCFIFNQPKDRVHKEGTRIQQLVSKKLEKKMPKLRKNEEEQAEEQKHRDWVRDQIYNDPKVLDDPDSVSVPFRKFAPVLADMLKQRQEKPKKEEDSEAEEDPENREAKDLLKNPAELEDLDIKQYYTNPVRFCFDAPQLAFA